MLPLTWFAEKLGVSLAVFLAAILLLTNGVNAQVAGAMLTGTVTDSSGAVIPKAQVTITDVATGVARRIAADSAGLYSAPNLLPGTYQVSVTAPGFATEVQNGITLSVGAQQVLDVTMRVGQVNETVQVTGEAPMVQLASSTISGEVNATTVRELPRPTSPVCSLGSFRRSRTPSKMSTAALGHSSASRALDRSRIITVWMASVSTIIRTAVPEVSLGKTWE